LIDIITALQVKLSCAPMYAAHVNEIVSSNIV